MKPDDLIGLGVILVGAVLILGKMIRDSRRLDRARPRRSEPPTQPRRYVMSPPEPIRVRPAPSVPAPPRASAPKRRPAPTSLEARVLENRRLSPGARLVVASEILSRPKALRRRPL
jgi:hypothetical protein